MQKIYRCTSCGSFFTEDELENAATRDSNGIWIAGCPCCGNDESYDEVQTDVRLISPQHEGGFVSTGYAVYLGTRKLEEGTMRLPLDGEFDEDEVTDVLADMLEDDDHLSDLILSL